MKRDMTKWIKENIALGKKKPMPILSFPAIQLLDITVKELISSAHMQARGMVGIANRVDTSASVSLMDLSVEAECFGAEIVVSDEEVPTVTGSIVSTPEDAEALRVPDVGTGRTGIYIQGVTDAVHGIEDRPVFAGTIGPFSLAGRLMDVTEAMIYCYEEPEMVHMVLRKCTDFLKQYMAAYKNGGANGVIMAEPLAGLLSPDLAEEFSCRYVKELVQEIDADDFLFVYHNCGGGTIDSIDQILETGARALHFGDAINMAKMMKHIPADRLGMGNLSPAHQVRNGTPESVREETLKLMEACSGYPNYIPSTGCDIPPMSPWENIDAFMAAVQEFYDRNN